MKTAVHHHLARFPLLLLVVSGCFAAWCAKGTPYATGLTNDAGVISFRLNEAADKVEVISSGGAVTNDLGALAAGLHMSNLGISGDFDVRVSRTSGLGYEDGAALQISDDANRLLQFFRPVGVAVVTDPASPYFGRIYVANVTNATTATGRPTGDGIFVLNSDFTDTFGQGDAALTGGLDFVNPPEDDPDKPWHIEVGEDGNLYIGNFGDMTGTIYVTDPNVADGMNLFVGEGSPGTGNDSPNHGRFGSSVIAFGSLTNGDLTVYALDADIPNVNGVKRYDIGSGPLPADVAPVDVAEPALLQISGVTVDLDIGPDGKYYLLQNRFDGNEAGLFVADPTLDNDANDLADLVYSSFGDTQRINGFPDPAAPDILRQARGVKISPDGRFMAVVRNDSRTWIVPLLDGIPDLENAKLINTGSASFGRDVAFDAAGNFYMVTSGHERLRVFSPGLQSIAITGSDGTFSVTNFVPQTPTVSLVGAHTNIYERMPDDAGRFVIGRIGGPDQALTVNYTLSGTAMNGVDYQTLPTSVVIPAGALAVTNSIVPIDNSNLDGDRSVIITLASNSNYNLSPDNSAVAMEIRDDEQEPGTVLFMDNFDTDSSANWNIVFGDTGGSSSGDFSAEFAYDYSIEGIPPAPHSSGTTSGVKLRVNKDEAPAAAAVNLYPIGEMFSGDFALRFDIYISVGQDTGGQTEHSIFGVNHSGTALNRHAATGGDGIWFAIDGDASNNRGFAAYVRSNPGVAAAPAVVRNNTPDFSDVFASPPWAIAGSPNNVTNFVAGTGSDKHWADVEVTHIDDVLTLYINAAKILEVTNTGAAASGTIMIGHNDQFPSLGSIDNYSIFDNVRVVSLGAADIEVTDIQIVGGNVQIDFTADPTDSTGSLSLYSSATVDGTYSPEGGAVITERSPAGTGLFRATVPANGPMRFYLIRRE